ncbi:MULTISPECIES: hypothetical protein [unclassified Synechocystis]|uniref:hypothetical protein n=1 Tax=unclassified Synechocystis TaxID=2640012 RepID=UPI0003FC2089|nr:MULTISPECIES: hypothetical protein [unclassified Synechocystis]AIE73546.1 hypothetical protein D082_10180 [Synechocystis sp. PCC 6714]MCT0254118.1 hypothetical protein [Synechocystis sp. CS-94]
MNLVNITDFDQALALLGLYEQEVMKTSIWGYLAEWPQHPSPPPAKAEPMEENPTKAIAPSPDGESLKIAEVAPTPIPASVPPLPGNVNVDNAENLTVIVNKAPLCPNEPPAIVAVETTAAEPNFDAQREALSVEQEKERRLFYLFVQELEHTGDLRKLPTVLHPPARS